MRKKIKFFISIFLLVSLLVSHVSVLAAVTNEIVTLAQDTQTSNEETNNSPVVKLNKATGKLEIVIGFDLPISNKNERKIYLSLMEAKENGATLNINANLVRR